MNEKIRKRFCFPCRFFHLQIFYEIRFLTSVRNALTQSYSKRSYESICQILLLSFKKILYYVLTYFSFFDIVFSLLIFVEIFYDTSFLLMMKILFVHTLINRILNVGKNYFVWKNYRIIPNPIFKPKASYV